MKSNTATIFFSVMISVIVCSLIFIGYNHFIYNKSDTLIQRENKESEVDYSLEKLRIMLYDLRNPSLGFTSVTFNFVIQISNPMDYSITSPKLFYDAYINDIHVAVGKTFLPEIPAKDNRKYPASFVLSYIDLGKSLINAIKHGNFTLKLNGKIISKGHEKQFEVTYDY